ncbi:apolipoprotein N-acyltransferase [Leptospira sp. GIMC2001]|uniref:apolipoprotein N-acyltransferase n=1 Tax=Leptospira sp. GIMC2001 TaxID=1513297 RepID=UPI00234A36D5|nr:nitrilase-related carbon-nitrogen hydrolase [Leptospira sp. GIMC2001]WCL50350.1 apolipoprotein N-acyltransferase [Leptospira sp. GIMC2001]
MNWKSWIFPITSALWVGVFSNYAFAPFSNAILVWLAPWGLFYLESRYRGQWKKLFWAGCLVAIVFYSFSFNWIIYMTVVFGGFPMFLALPIFFISAIILNLWFPFFLMLFSFLIIKVKKEFAWVAGFVCLLGEFVTPQVFPWYWGSIVAGHETLAQTAEIMSIYGLSFLLFVVSYTMYSWWGRDILLSPARWKRIPQRFRLLQKLYLPIALFIIFYVVGFSLYVKWNNVVPSRYVDTLVIQPNAPLEFRDGRSVAETINDLMKRIDELAVQGKASSPDPVDLIVLPESGVPFFSAHKHSATISPPMYWDRYDSLMFLLANRLQSNIFFNELDASFKDNIRTRANRRLYNSSTLYDPNGERKKSYQKVFLLIFGEYMPFDWMYALSPQTGRFEPGKSLELIPYYSKERKLDSELPKPISYEDTLNIGKPDVENYYSELKTPTTEVGKFLPLICYEVIVPEFVRTFRDSGNPDFFVNVTNDKWYGVSAETFQHGDLARIRSIEWRKWMVRSTNSGSSFFVDHLGRIVDNEFSAQEASLFMRKKVGVVDSEQTFYVKYGNLLSWMILLGLSIRYGFIYWKKRK